MTQDFIGKPFDQLATPALVVDIEALEHNLRFLANYFSSRPAKLRPHFKSHKCVTISRRQLETGSAVGITCAKLSEAELLVAGGVKDVLIANQVVGPEKAARLAALNAKATVRCAVDCEAGINWLSKAASQAGVTIGVLVEVDIGMRRCGVQPGQAAMELARKAKAAPGLRFDGLQAYEGHIVSLPDFEERKQKVTKAMQPLAETKALLDRAGIACNIVSGGGTGTYEITGNLPVFNEIQAGSYALMDCSYKEVCPQFANALSIVTSIVSATNSYSVVDVGLKGMGNEFGMPIVPGAPEAKSRSLSEEHVAIDNFVAKVGDKIRLIPSHGCTTCNLHRRLFITRKGIIEDVWPIEASGALE